MSRTVNEQRPQELLDAIVLYLTEHGIVDLSLRPLAKAVGSSPRGLLYHFGSKEQMIVKVLAELRQRQRTIYNQTSAADFEQACQDIWKQISAAESEPLFRLFFEAYGVALRQPKLYADFLRSAVDDWLDFVGHALQVEGHLQRKDARVLATIVLAGFRGFMLDYCATHDRKRLDRAVSLWLGTLKSISYHPKEG